LSGLNPATAPMMTPIIFGCIGETNGKNKSNTSKTKPSLGRETKTWGNAESLEGRSTRETEKLGRQFAFQPEST